MYLSSMSFFQCFSSFFFFSSPEKEKRERKKTGTDFSCRKKTEGKIVGELICGWSSVIRNSRRSNRGGMPRCTGR